MLSGVFEKVNLKVHDPDDSKRGQVAIQLDAPLLGATLSFWNKRDVMVIGIDKVNQREFSLDDRVMDANENVASLLNSYTEKLMHLLSAAKSRK